MDDIQSLKEVTEHKMLSFQCLLIYTSQIFHGKSYKITFTSKVSGRKVFRLKDKVMNISGKLNTDLSSEHKVVYLLEAFAKTFIQLDILDLHYEGGISEYCKYGGVSVYDIRKLI